MEINLNIVYPCYNPSEGWEKKLVASHKKFVLSIPDHYVVQMILVNDGSTKGINQNHIVYIRSEIPQMLYINNTLNSGKGFALRSAMKKITDGWIIYTDVDNPYKLENTLEMFSILRSNECDVVIGVRPISYFKQLPLSRFFFSLALRIANYLFFPNLFTKDTQSGLKGFNQKGKSIFLKTNINGFLFDIEFIRLCTNEQLRIRKVKLQLNAGVSFTPLRTKVIKQEIRNFIKLLQ